MVKKNCEICGREVDARGYNVHLRKCKEVQTLKLNEITEANMSKEKEPEIKPEIKEPDIKNSKTPTVAKIIAAVLGVIIAAVTFGVLMLISPKSKELSKKESTQTRNMISRRHR